MFRITGLGTFVAAVVLGFAGFGTTSIITSDEAVAQNHFRGGGYRGQGRRVARRTARRTTRRVVRRQYLYYGGVRRAYISVLPVGCPAVVYQGARHYYCGNVYYRPHFQGNATVYVIVQ
jgi:hypothetical protein